MGAGRRGEARAERQRGRGVQGGGKRAAVSAARPTARRRGEVELLDALDEFVVNQGLREAAVDLLVHGVQLLVAFRRVGGEHAHAPLTLVRSRTRVRVRVRVRADLITPSPKPTYPYP